MPENARPKLELKRSERARYPTKSLVVAFGYCPPVSLNVALQGNGSTPDFQQTFKNIDNTLRQKACRASSSDTIEYKIGETIPTMRVEPPEWVYARQGAKLSITRKAG